MKSSKTPTCHVFYELNHVWFLAVKMSLKLPVAHLQLVLWLLTFSTKYVVGNTMIPWITECTR